VEINAYIISDTWPRIQEWKKYRCFKQNKMKNFITKMTTKKTLLKNSIQAEILKVKQRYRYSKEVGNSSEMIL
jgi:hypothetical protein